MERKIIRISQTRLKEKAGKKDNPEKKEMVFSLRKLGPFWIDVAAQLAKPRRQIVTVSIEKLNKSTKEGEVVVVPGKVLSPGELDHKITLSAFSYSENAREKLKNAKVMPIGRMAESFKDGKGVRILC